MSKVAVIQESPVFLNREETINKAIAYIEQAASAGAQPVSYTHLTLPTITE